MNLPTISPVPLPTTLPTGIPIAVGQALTDLFRESSRQDHEQAMVRLAAKTQVKLRMIDAELQMSLAEIAAQDRDSQRNFELALAHLQMKAHERSAVIASLCRTLENPQLSEAARLQVVQTLMVFLANTPL